MEADFLYKQDPSQNIKIKDYSGPLDLLLDLIKKEEMDILSINISTITHQYLNYIEQISDPDLENVGEFIRLAAVLIYIKSKTLLPDEEGEEEMEDYETAQKLKENLIQNLYMYQRFQSIGKLLYKRDVLNRDVWISQAEEKIPTLPNDEIEINSDNALLTLMSGHAKLIDYKEEKKELSVKEPLPTLLDRIKDMLSFLAKGTELQFFKMIKIRPNSHSSLLTFLSLLELSKLGFTSLFQKNNFQDIAVKINKQIGEDSFVNLSHEEEDWLR